jgi:hypothetical protein
LDRISRQAHPATHYPQEDSPESPTSWSVRRIKSDPTPARWAPLGRPGNALADPTDRENRAEDPDVASLSPCPSPYPPSLIESSLVSKTSPFQRHKRASSLAKQHHALDFKTPDNAWDSLSFVGWSCRPYTICDISKASSVHLPPPLSVLLVILGHSFTHIYPNYVVIYIYSTCHVLFPYIPCIILFSRPERRSRTE